MKNIKYFLSAVFVIATLSGCGAWHQDPLDGKDEAFKNGQKNPTLGEKPKVTPSDSVILDNEGQLYIFDETVEGTINLTGRVLLPGYSPTIYIDNLSDFPGYQYDAVKGEFKWTPPVGTVDANSDREMRKPLKVHIVGTPANGNIVSRGFVLDVRVRKALSTPEIFWISKASASMREGDMMNVTVKIRDKDAGNDVRSYPSLQILPTVGVGNISQFVTITQVLATGNNEFVVNLNIDLSGAELTKTRDRYGFTLKAISRFQKPSSDQDVRIDVTTSYSALQSTWFNVLEVPLGVKKEFQFMIFDPKDELLVGAPTFSGLPNGATIDCSEMGKTRQFCSFSWTPDFTVAPGTYSVTAQVTAQNQDRQDTLVKNYNFKLDLNVTSAPPVTPVALKGGR